MNNKLLIVIVGPTAIGKTSLSLHLANVFHTEVISADSRQFYKEMQIGTAVPTADELAVAPHHFIQHKSVQEDYSVGDFEREALQKISERFQEKRNLIMVGGSGLYVDAVTKGLDKFPEVEPTIREDLNRQLREEGISALQQKLASLDPEYFRTMDQHNPHRLIRALEICLGTGRPFSSFRKNKVSRRPFNTIYIGLTASRETVYSRINQRVELMMKEGLLEEARTLYDKRDYNALNTVGYKELFNYFDGNWSLEQAVEEIKKNTRRFAKRQFTWFKKNPDIRWFDYTTPGDEIADYIKHVQA